MGTGEQLSGKPDEMLGGYLRWTSFSSRGVAILLVTSCYRNQDKLWLCGPLGLCADFTLPVTSSAFQSVSFSLQSGTIDLEEFIGGIALCLHGTVKDKCRILFHIFNLVIFCYIYIYSIV